MTDLFALIEMVGPVMGLLLFIVLKQLQIGAIKPTLISMESKLDLLVTRTESTNAEPIDEPNDSGGDLPTKETVR